MSTHRPSLLQAETTVGDLVVVGLQREPGGDTSAILFGPNLIEDFRVAMRELGISASELMFLARGLLLVEGPADANVITTIYGEDLGARGIFVHSLGGSDATSIVRAFNHSAYEMLGIPVWVMLDSTTDDRLPPELQGERSGTSDGKLAKARESIPKLRSLPFGAPDMCCGITASCHADAFGEAFPTDDDATYREWAGFPNASVAKAWFTERAPVPDDEYDDYIRHVQGPLLRHIRANRVGKDAASPWLASSMQRLFDDFDSIYGEGGERRAELD